MLRVNSEETPASPEEPSAARLLFPPCPPAGGRLGAGCARGPRGRARGRRRARPEHKADGASPARTALGRHNAPGLGRRPGRGARTRGGSSPRPRPHPRPRRPLGRCPRDTRRRRGREVGPARSGPRAGKGEGQRGAMGSRETAPKEESPSPGAENEPRSGPELPGERPPAPTPGPGQPRSAAPRPHAPRPGTSPAALCVRLSPLLRARHRAPGRSPSPAPRLPSRADYLSGLRSGPGMPSAPGEQAIHRRAARAGGRGAGAEGARAGQNLRPWRSRGGPGRGSGGAAREGGGGERTGEPRSGQRASEGARRGSEGAASRRERERCSDRDCHWGQRSTAPGSGAAEAPLRARSPAGPRAPARPCCSPGRRNPRRRPEAAGLREEAGAEGEAGSLLVLPGQAGGRKLSCKFITMSAISVKMIGGRGGGGYGVPGK